MFNEGLHGFIEKSARARWLEELLPLGKGSDFSKAQYQNLKSQGYSRENLLDRYGTRGSSRKWGRSGEQQRGALQDLIKDKYYRKGVNRMSHDERINQAVNRYAAGDVGSRVLAGEKGMNVLNPSGFATSPMANTNLNPRGEGATSYQRKLPGVLNKYKK